MRIAIQGHFERCKEVIDTLINLGGINKHNYVGDDAYLCYYIDECKHIEAQFISKIDENFYKCYTLEEFEKLNKMETRNITLTLNKAKEWYNKGGELKEIALQAFTKEELNPLPKSWEEYCKGDQVPVMIFGPGISNKYVALWKLELLRDCYRQGWKPDWTDAHTNKYCIYYSNNELDIMALTYTCEFLSFQSGEVAEEFLKNFKSLIKEAGDLI